MGRAFFNSYFIPLPQILTHPAAWYSAPIFCIYYFLPLALLGYYALGRRTAQRLRNLWLILTGYTFYGWAEPRFMALMFVTTSVDWLLSLMIAHNTARVWRVWGDPVKVAPPRRPRTTLQSTALTVSVCSNLMALGFFKYFNFGAETFTALMRSFGSSSAQWDNLLHVTFFR